MTPVTSYLAGGEAEFRKLLNLQLILLLRESREPVIGNRFAIFQNELRDHFAECWTVFESVARSTAHDPDIRIRRMPIDDEVVIGRVLVLADAGFHERCILHPGKTMRKIAAGFGQAVGGDDPFS
jgi:hypothetical protein